MIKANIIQQSISEAENTDSLLITGDSTSIKIQQQSLSRSISQLENEIQEKLRQLLSRQKQQLSEVGENINSLTEELEKAIIEFHKIAKVTNNTYRSLQSFVKQNSCKKIEDISDESTIVLEEFKIIINEESKLPIVEKKHSVYTLKEQKIDLSKLD